MTNSHNRTIAGGRNGERYAHGSSPPHHSNHGGSSVVVGGGGGGGSIGNYFSNRKNNFHHHRNSIGQRSSLSNNTTLLTTSFGGSGGGCGGNSLLSSSPPRSGNRYSKNNNNYHNNNNSNNNNYHNNRTNGVQILMGISGSCVSGGGQGTSLLGIESLPPTLTHFAGSKCFDAPSPTALPKPPQHWTSPTPSTLRRSHTSSSSVFIAKVASSIVCANKLLNDSHNLKTLLNVQA